MKKKKIEKDVNPEKAEEKVSKTKRGATKVTSVKSYQQGIDAMKQKMAPYLKKFDADVKGLRNDIQDQVKENKKAASHMAESVMYFLSQLENLKADFQSYTTTFWGK